MAHVYDCVIVGGGYAGLSAAKTLKEHGKSVLVLEANNRVGGRAWTKHHDDGTYEDYGGMFVSPHQKNIYRLASESGIRIFDLFPHGKSIFNYRGRTSTYNGRGLPPFGWIDLIDTGNVLRQFEKLSDTVNLEEPWDTPNAQDLDTTTVAEWARSMAWTEAGLDTIRASFEMILGHGWAQVSLLHAAWYCKSGVSLTVLSSIDQGAQAALMVGGGQAIANSLSKSLDDAVRLEEPVVAIDQSGPDVLVKTSKGTYHGKQVIFATPPHHVLSVEFKPPLPPQKLKLAQSMPMGQYVKMLATYPDPFWRKEGLRGDAISLDGYMGTVIDVSPIGSTCGQLIGFIGGSKAIALLDMEEDHRREVILTELETYYGSKARDFIRLTLHTMISEKWSTGCPTASPAPGVLTSMGKWLRKPVGKVHWAGTETAAVWSGYMEGAVISGTRAAEEVLDELEVRDRGNDVQL